MNYLSDRMKEYESTSNFSLKKKTPVVGRVDGKSFSKFTKCLKKEADSPWSIHFVNAMLDAAKAACTDIQGCQFAYVQSDEISFYISDEMSEEAQPYFGYETRKLNSIVASTVTLAFYKSLISKMPELSDSNPRFDSRFWNVPADEIKNVFVWRQLDAIRNSVQMLARHHFSHKDIDGKNVEQMKEMLRTISPWEDLPLGLKQGFIIQKKVFEEEVVYQVKGLESKIMAQRTRWVASPAPLIKKCKLDDLI